MPMDSESMISGYSERSRRHLNVNNTSKNLINSAYTNYISSNTLSNTNTIINNHDSLLGRETNILIGNNNTCTNVTSVNSNAIDLNHINTSNNTTSDRNLTSLSYNNKLNQSTCGHHRSKRNRKERGEIIEVQIIPQDDQWGDNTTAITSERSISFDDLNKINNDNSNKTCLNDLYNRCVLWSNPIIIMFIYICAFISPIIMIILPKLSNLDWKIQKCNNDCDALLISFVFKLLILTICSWAIFFRRSNYTLPRLDNYRTSLLALLTFLIIVYWIFYNERIFSKRSNDYELTYYNIVTFSITLIDILLWIHYLAVILLQIRGKETIFIVKVTRSPDGVSRFYQIGAVSIQKASIQILHEYYVNFPVYNPYLQITPRRNRNLTDDCFDSSSKNGHSRHSNHSGHSGHTGHNDRYYEENEYERRVKKRRARLITCVEQAFTHIKRVQRDIPESALPMEPREAAQAIFPSISRTLQKYLRITRQQPFHTIQSILDHLTLILNHHLSPNTFLEKYFNTTPVYQQDSQKIPYQSWGLICDTLASRIIEIGSHFVLIQGDVSLLVQVYGLTHLRLKEEMIEKGKFAFRLNSETSV